MATGNTTSSNRTSVFLALAIAFYLLTAGWNLGVQTIANPDEPRYSCAARTMLRDGDWIVPKFNSQPRLVKPILFYWVIAASGKLCETLGLSLATGIRFGPFFSGLLTVIGTFLIARRLTGNCARAGLVAAALLMSCNWFHRTSREIVIDMTLTACLTWAWYFVLIALDRIAQKSRAFLPLLGFYTCLGLACMAKGPLPVAGFVVFPLLVYLFFTLRMGILLRAGLWWGAPLALAIGFWWFYALGKTGHESGVSEFFFVENFKRIFGEKDHVHAWPWLYYFQIFPEGLLPWIAVVPLICWWTVKSLQTGRMRVSSDSVLFAASALGAAFAIIGVSQSKRPLYLLPLFPPFAIWISLLWKQSVEPFPARAKAGWIAIGCALALCLGFEIVYTPYREQLEDRIAFFAAIDKQLNGRGIVTLGESANEAIWYLDRAEPISNLTYPALKAKFFEAPGTVLLLKQQELDKTPELKASLKIELERKRGKDKRGQDETYFLATPDPAHPPEATLFERKNKDTGED